MVAFILTTLIIFVAQKRKVKGILKYTFSILLISLIFYQILMFFGYNLGDWFSQRLFAEGSIQSTTRYGALVNFIMYFPQAIFLGTGVHLTSELEYASHSVGSSQIHVGYLSHLLSYGLVGSFLLFGFWYMLAKKLYNTAKSIGYWGSFFAFLIFLWANSTLVMYSIFFYGLIFALIFDKYFIDRSISTQRVNSINDLVK